MREQTCTKCGKSFPLNEMVYIYGDVFCHPCGDEHLETVDPENLSDEELHPMTDPTICSRCQSDNGRLEYDLFLEMPVCENCKEFMQDYPFPIWIKAAAVGLMLIVIFSIGSNFRFFRARVLMDNSLNHAFQQGSLAQASEEMQAATELVPESKDIQLFSDYLQGIHAIQQEENQAAIEHLSKCAEMPSEYGIDSLIDNARMGLAFDNKEYDKFLERCVKYKQNNPNNPIAAAQVASAYACLYAVDGTEESKQNAMDHLLKAEILCKADMLEHFTEYKERILYRIETREVLTRDEYYERTGKTPPEDKL